MRPGGPTLLSDGTKGVRAGPSDVDRRRHVAFDTTGEASCGNVGKRSEQNLAFGRRQRGNVGPRSVESAQASRVEDQLPAHELRVVGDEACLRQLLQAPLRV